MAINLPTNKSLGANVKAFPETQYEKIVEIINTLNGITGGTGPVSATTLDVSGTATFNGAIVLGDAAADSLTVNATTTYTDPINYSNATGITAFATGGQASATALTEEVNNITTVATAGDSVKLPAAVAGKHVHIKNSGAAALDIFPASADSIDALAVNLAIRIQPGSSIDFYAKDGIVWESSLDNSITLNSPTTVTGQLEIKATASAGNTVTTITNASQAAARTYTVPDAGASASFVMTEGNASIAGVKTFTDTTASTTKDTGGAIFEGGVGIEKEVYAGLSINAGTSLSVGTNVTLAKEVNHTITVDTTTTAATAGANLDINAATGATSGAGGNTTVAAGQGGLTGTGGDLNLASGLGGATSGNSGAVYVFTQTEAGTDASGLISVGTGSVETANSGANSITTGAVLTSGDSGSIDLTTGTSAIGGTGDVSLITGAASSGLAGDIILETGTHTSATVSPIISLNKGVVKKPGSSTVASGGTITGPELVRGLIDATGATGNWQLPTCAQITTAIGSTPTGTNFEFLFNAAAMTATNTATLVVGAGMTVMSAPPITGGGTLTVTQDTQVVGLFRIFYDTATTCKISRIA